MFILLSTWVDNDACFMEKSMLLLLQHSKTMTTMVKNILVLIVQTKQEQRSTLTSVFITVKACD